MIKVSPELGWSIVYSVVFSHPTPDLRSCIATASQHSYVSVDSEQLLLDRIGKKGRFGRIINRVSRIFSDSAGLSELCVR